MGYIDEYKLNFHIKIKALYSFKLECTTHLCEIKLDFTTKDKSYTLNGVYKPSMRTKTINRNHKYHIQHKR